MKKPDTTRSKSTRQRVLEKACAVFAEEGFKRATVAEICGKAGANIAAVNYHFGCKNALYVEAWRYALERSLKDHPPDGGVPLEAPAEARLRGRVLSIIQRIVDPESHDFDMVYKEMANSTGLLRDAMRQSLDPLRREFASLLRELLGEKATERQIRLCHMSIMSQCFGPVLRERRRKRDPKTSLACGHEPLTDDAEALADHIVTFSLAGIREIRRCGSVSRRRRKC